MSVARAPLPSEQEPLGTLVQRLGNDVNRVVRAEIALARARAEHAVDVVKAAGAGFVAAAVLAVVGVAAIVAGIVLLVAALLPLWLAALAVGGALLVIAGVVVMIEVRVVSHGVGEALAPVDGRPAEVPHGR